jgi:large subunit ribosomal protein L3
MSIGVIGRKCGSMTRVFTEDGASIPVSVVEVSPNLITQLKTDEVDGYRAIQVTTGARKATRVNKAQAGHFAKAKVVAGRGSWEFRLADDENVDLSVGDAITVAQFKVGQMVDVTGTTRGKGFAGTVKRHNFRTQDATHGNSLSHRVPGSIGQNQTPGRVFKGKRMAGHMGDVRVTIGGLEIIKVDVERNALLIKGAIPGAPGGDIIIRPACKYKNKTAVDAA